MNSESEIHMQLHLFAIHDMVVMHIITLKTAGSQP